MRSKKGRERGTIVVFFVTFLIAFVIFSVIGYILLTTFFSDEASEKSSNIIEVVNIKIGEKL